MVAYIIRWSVENRFLVIVLTLLVFGWGVLSLREIPVDAIPDLSDVQVIVKTNYPGQAPQVVEEQVTYPLATAMLSVPGATAVRGYSFFGDSYIYVLFDDDTDLYWARSRVLEYLSQIAPTLPPSAKPVLGPDATGVGWIYQYALVDRTGAHDLGDLRSLQDWFLKYELQTVPGVSEVATIGGMVRQYQVIANPNKLRAYGIPLATVRNAILKGNGETGGGAIEMAEAEYMVRMSGYVTSIEDLEVIPIGVVRNGTPLYLKDVADIRIGPELRRGIGELDGEGEAVGGVIVMRWGENAMATIDAVKIKLQELEAGLPPGVEIIETYDRSELIERAIDNLAEKLLEEFVVVAIICALFLFHLRSAAVIVISLPVGVLAAFIVMNQQGLNANIMSLGGIAIAVGAMVDGAIVMIENMHKHIERDGLTSDNRWALVTKSAQEVGPALFFSLLIITLSFVPIFALEAQEGRLFHPLAYTKTYAMAGAAFLSITLVPVLMGLFIRGRVRPEHENPVNRKLVDLYRPFIDLTLRRPRVILGVAVLAFTTALWPMIRLGSEFMPELYEGDLLYMPSTYPAISVGKAGELLQQTDRLIKTLPEVKSVYGKAGRAETATDPAPLTMFETTIQLNPRKDWRPGMTVEKLRAELDALLDVPGVTNAWTMPIRNRIDMLATGIKTPVGIKVAGPDFQVLASIGEQLEEIVGRVPGAASVYAERVTGGRFIDIEIDRRAAARFALNVDDIQLIVRTAIGGMKVTESVEGLERYPINLRYPASVRDSLEQLRALPVVTPSGAHIPLSRIADIGVSEGPGMVRSENARPNGWVYVDISGRDIGSFVADARRVVDAELDLPAGYSLSWSGQYEFMERAKARLSIVVPVTITIIALLLFLNFRNLASVAIILGTLPLSAIGGLWLIYLLGYDLSVAVGVGFIAVAGVAVEIGVLMMVYLSRALDQTMQTAEIQGRALVEEDIKRTVIDGALMRVRPIAMTVSATIVGLLPIMFGSGTGSEVMRRIAAPMVGGMVSATALTLLVIPAIFYLWKTKTLVKRKTT